ncbi:MAG: hypothetical protein MR279_05585, partial [Bacteroidales bacterium]|nr:hypothetical protein [Bacteroidales bacterium]
MKRPICLFILCFLALCINAQQTYKNIDLIIKGNLIPLADNGYEKEMNSASVTPYLRNYIPSIEIGLNNTYFFDFRYRVLLSEKQIETSLSGNPLSLNTKTTARHRCYSYSVAGGYNVLKNHPRHVAKIALVAGIVQNRTENCENNTASNNYFLQNRLRNIVQILPVEALRLWCKLRIFLRKRLQQRPFHQLLQSKHQPQILRQYSTQIKR